MFLLFLQGLFNAVLEVSATEITLKLWHGISDSPILGVYSGYGIGSCIGVILMMKFIKFNPNETKLLSPEDIKLQVPFSSAGLFGIFVVACFIILHYFETKKNIKFKNDDKKQKLNLLTPKNEIITKLSKFEIIFNSKFISKNVCRIKIIQLILLTLLSITLSGYVCINASFLLPYTTKGPAKFSVENFFIIKITFWTLNVFGRFIGALIAFKVNSSKFFFNLLFLNLTLVIIYAIPSFHVIENFHWYIVILMAFTIAPIIPSCFMITKYTLVNTSPTKLTN